MIVCIVGWYGTETLGDTAILDGILKVLSRCDTNVQVNIGSLYPFYSERTLYEEAEIFKHSAPNAQITVFNIKDKRERKRFIKNTDLLLIGGGPLMDLEELFIVEDSFKIAKKHNVISFVMGCGLGPLKKTAYIKAVKSILDMATAVSFRDQYSLSMAGELGIDLKKCTCLGDPAVISIESYYKNNKGHCEDYVAVNLRKYPQNEYGGKISVTDKVLQQLIERLTEYGNVMLVPMHTFSIGGDDRFYLTELTKEIHNDRIKVLHKPQNLVELYRCFQNAQMCVGMRYHSIVMQTILNGNNYILNYTDKQNGKIQGFIQSLDNGIFFRDRIFSLADSNKIADFDSIFQCAKQYNRYEYQCGDMELKYIEFIKNM